MADKKKNKTMTLHEARETVTPAQQKKLNRGYMNYRKRRHREEGGAAAIAPRERWMDIWRGSGKYK